MGRMNSPAGSSRDNTEVTADATLNPQGTTAAVIVTHKRVELLRHSLEQVVNQTHPVNWVVVVDNGCESEVQDLVTELAGEKAVYLPSRTNLGGAGGFAYGFLQALALGADAIWCADDDLSLIHI